MICKRSTSNAFWEQFIKLKKNNKKTNRFCIFVAVFFCVYCFFETVVSVKCPSFINCRICLNFNCRIRLNLMRCLIRFDLMRCRICFYLMRYRICYNFMRCRFCYNLMSCRICFNVSWGGGVDFNRCVHMKSLDRVVAVCFQRFYFITWVKIKIYFNGSSLLRQIKTT